MKKKKFIVESIATLLLGFTLIFSACGPMSEKETASTAGLNGGFEITKNNLPVNWIMYSPTTVSNSNFSIELDTDIFKEGNQSLKFDVSECTSNGGWSSPGFTNEFFEAGKFEGPGIYKLSYWVKNNGSRYQINAGAVSAKKGDMEIVLEGKDDTSDWMFAEHEIDVPEKRHLRMELNILEPGTFWIDDVQVNKISSDNF